MNSMLSDFQDYIRVVPIKAYSFQPGLNLKILDAGYKLPTEPNTQFLNSKPKITTSTRALNFEKSERKLQLPTEGSSISNFRIEGNTQPTNTSSGNVFLVPQWRPSSAKNTNKSPYIALAIMRRKKEKQHIAELLKKTDKYFVKVDESLIHQTNMSDTNSSFYRPGLKGRKVREKKTKSQKAHSFYLEKPHNNHSLLDSLDESTSFGVFQDSFEAKTPKKQTNNSTHGQEAVKKLTKIDPNNLSPSPIATDYSGTVSVEKMIQSRKLVDEKTFTQESQKTPKWHLQQHYGIAVNDAKSQETYKLKEILSQTKDQVTDASRKGSPEHANAFESPEFDLAATPNVLEQPQVGYSPGLLRLNASEFNSNFTAAGQIELGANKRSASTEPEYSSLSNKQTNLQRHDKDGAERARTATGGGRRQHSRLATIGHEDESHEIQTRHARIQAARNNIPRDTRMTHYTFDFGRFIKIMNPEKCTMGRKLSPPAIKTASEDPKRRMVLNLNLGSIKKEQQAFNNPMFNKENHQHKQYLNKVTTNQPKVLFGNQKHGRSQDKPDPQVVDRLFNHSRIAFYKKPNSLNFSFQG